MRYYELQPGYKGALPKLGGEPLVSGKKHGVDFNTVLKIRAPIKICTDLDVQIDIIMGGGGS